MDSTICVTFDTALVIAMEVPVEKPTHHPQQSSHSMVYGDCVGSLTDRTKLTRDTNYRVRVPGRGYIAKSQ
jgi:hypothetical protein